MQVSLEALLKEEIFMNLTTRLNNKKVKDFLFEAKLADAKLSELKIYIEKVDLFKTIEQFLAEKSFQELGFTKEMQELFVTLLLEKIANKKRFLEKLELTKQVKKSQIEEKLTSLVGDIDGKSLKPGYHQEMSLQHLYSALETHKQGRAYRQMLDNMRYLDDDYNDSILHFGAALERYMINIGKIRKAIYEVRSSLKGNESALYKAENYMPT